MKEQFDRLDRFLFRAQILCISGADGTTTSRMAAESQDPCIAPFFVVFQMAGIPMMFVLLWQHSIMAHADAQVADAFIHDELDHE